MGFRQNSYATVWEVKQGNGNYTDVRLSTSRKNKQTGQYETDFSGFVRFIGTAHQNAGSLKERDRIKIGDCEVTNTYNKEKQVTYTNFAVFSFELANSNGTSQAANNTAKSSDGFIQVPDDVDDSGLPFN
jgi:single-strand DNA-binding protein